MKPICRRTRSPIWTFLLFATVLPLAGCGTGSVYVGVAAPGPWVGYPPGVYGGYPGYYGRPWYAPEDEEPQEDPLGPLDGASAAVDEDAMEAFRRNP
jgi:hypothetical protein